MSNNHSNRIQELFLNAVELPADERDAWLVEQCAGDALLLEEVRSLLAHDSPTEDALEHGLELPTISGRLPGSTVGLHVRCPHCRQPIELVDNRSFDHVRCASCGSDLSLVGLKDDGAAKQEIEQSLGHFDLIEKVGMGAFGSVYKANDTKLDRTVAIKVPRKHQLSADETEKFLREARTAAQLQHPNIVSVHEVGMIDDRVYIVSDFVEGVTLKEWMTRLKPTPREAARMFYKIAKALHYAHEHGVIHRDLKPGNIILDTEDEPHLMDFGLAKREAGEITMTMEGQILGTPAYMSPEQARGEGYAVDRRADIYAMGVILFHMLTGELPFRGDVRMLLHQVLTDEAPSPRKYNSAIPVDLETICLKCMEKDPDRRYPSAEELANDIQNHLEHRPIGARPISSTQRFWRWCRRRPVIAGLAGMLVLSLTAGTVISSYFAIDANHKAEDLEDKVIEVQRAESELRDEVILSYERLAEIALQRGKWTVAIDNIDKAIKAGHEDTVSLRIKKADAMFANNSFAGAEAELSQVLTLPAIGEKKGAAMLRLGILRLMKGKGVEQADRALVLIKESMEHHLDTGDEALAKAILAKTFSEGIQHIRRALAVRPFDYTAHVFLSFYTLGTSGIDESMQLFELQRKIFPENLEYIGIEALLKAVQGDRDGAINLLKTQGQGLPKHIREGLIGVIDAMYAAKDQALQYGDDITPTQQAMGLINSFSRMSAASSVMMQSDENDAGIFSAFLYLPSFRSFTQGAGKMVGAFLLNSNERKATASGELARISPTCIFSALHGVMLIHAALDKANIEEKRQSLEAAVKVLDHAIDAPPFFGQWEINMARFGRLIAVRVLEPLSRLDSTKKNVDPTWIKRAKSDLPFALAWLTTETETDLVGTAFRPPPDAFVVVVNSAIQFGEPGIALAALDTIEKNSGADKIKYANLRAKVLMQLNAPIAALNQMKRSHANSQNKNNARFKMGSSEFNAYELAVNMIRKSLESDEEPGKDVDSVSKMHVAKLRIHVEQLLKDVEGLDRQLNKTEAENP